MRGKVEFDRYCVCVCVRACVPDMELGHIL